MIGFYSSVRYPEMSGCLHGKKSKVPIKIEEKLAREILCL